MAEPISIYDKVAFPSLPHAASHPERLATIARLRSVPAPPVEQCRVVELGCGAGGNLIPLAATLRNSEFLGLDLSLHQIELARENATAAQLDNVRFEAIDLLQADALREPCDYLICHGVYSWTTEPVRQRILELARDWLTPHGILYLIYNTYPGWHLQGLVRDAISMRARAAADPEERIRLARATIDVLLAELPSDSPHHRWLRQELEAARQHTDAYLFHAYLNVTNEPFYLEAVVQQAERCGLQYLGDADPQTMWPAVAAPAVDERLRHTLDALSALYPSPVLGGPSWIEEPSTEVPGGGLTTSTKSLVAGEQLYDFIQFTTSRHSLFCRAGTPLRIFPRGEFSGLHLSAHLRIDEAVEGGNTGSITWATSSGHRLTVSDPRFLAAIRLLAAAWPESRSWEWIEQHVLQSHPLDWSDPAAGESWRREALRCFAAGIIELSVRANPCCRNVSSTPRATAFARHQAATQPLVSNLRHFAVRLGPFDRAVLRQLDGRRTLPEIEAGVRQSLPGTAVESDDVAHSLRRLAAHALLLRDAVAE